MPIPFLVLKEKVVEQIRTVVPLGTKEVYDRSYVRFSFVYKNADFILTLKEIPTTLGFTQTSNNIFEIVVSVRTENTKIYNNKFAVDNDGNWNSHALEKKFKELFRLLELRKKFKDQAVEQRESFIKKLKKTFGSNVIVRNFEICIKQGNTQISVVQPTENKIKEIIVNFDREISVEQLQKFVKNLK